MKQYHSAFTNEQNMKKIICIGAAFACISAFVGCGNKNAKTSENTTEADTINLIGQWTTSNPNDSTAQLGIELKENGIASSINMPTLPYDQWTKVNDSTVAIHGKSILDGEEIELTDTFDLDKEKSVLKQRNTDIEYSLSPNSSPSK